VDNKIEAMDKEKSEYEYEFRIYSIYKFVLDREALKKIPLEKRLVFRLREALSRTVFHKSIVDAIMAENPTGVQFRPIENWEF
jgi:predicted glycosyltransferase